MIWRNRPDDESFLTLQSLHDATKERAAKNRVEVLPCGELEFSGERLSPEVDRITLNAPTSRVIGNVDLTPTHWAYGQLCTKAEVYAPWAREKSHPEIVAAALNWGLQVEHGNDNVMMVARDDKAICTTGPNYGRIYDYEFAEAIGSIVDDNWIVPTEISERPGGTTLYSSDRDAWIFQVHRNQVIRVADSHGVMREYHRGFMAWNSEVGYKKIGFKTFYFDGICFNRTVYNVGGIRETSLRHSKNAPLRFLTEAAPMLRAFVNSSPSAEERIFNTAAQMKVGDKQEDVENWLKGKGFNKSRVSQIISQGRRDTGAVPDTLLDIVNAGTSYAKGIPHTDTRVAYEEDVSKLLRLAA